MKAVICAAGEGKRLRPHTNEHPKCLLVVGNKTIIEHMLDNISESGIKEVIIVVGYKKQTIVNKIGNKYKNCNITYILNKDYSKTNNMYSLWLALEKIDDNIIFFNADILFNGNILKEILNNKNDSIAVAPEIKEDSMRVRINNGLVKELGKELKGKVHGDAIGIYKLSKNTAKEYSKTANKIILSGDINSSFVNPINLISNDVDFYPLYVDQTKWAEIDTPDDYSKAKELIENIKK